MSNLNEFDIATEQYRTYIMVNKVGQTVEYRIDEPVTLFIRPGGSTHRVLDSKGIVHCVPAPEMFGSVIIWENKDPKNPCEF